MTTVTMTMQPTEKQQTLRPLVQYFAPSDEHRVAAGEMVHDYYGVPLWLMKEYLERIGAAHLGGALFEKGECHMRLAPAKRKHIGSLEIGGATVEFTGRAGDIQEVLTQLEWKTLRC